MSSLKQPLEESGRELKRFMELENLSNRYKKFQLGLTGFLSVAIFYYAGLFVYWYFEPDPLSVEYIEDCPTISVCEDRVFSFIRRVESTKEIMIYVQERYYDLDGTLDLGDYNTEFIMGSTVPYPVGKDVAKNLIFSKKVPEMLPIGRYEYRPWATYVVNPIKTITKPLPTQKVFVNCDPPIKGNFHEYLPK